ncbi:hypothetical protein EU538_01360 [Candidatus Thorarchaeota archaeon]|jgi:ribosome biogenesis protein Nip4|nr:MAG: hypothetical protein EU538_01360 [Candidatus Thorarchaeota archaeon]
MVSLIEPHFWDNIKRQIDGDFGEGVTQQLLGDRAPVVIDRGKKQSVYFIPMDWVQLVDSSFGGFRLRYLGTWLGEMSGDTFMLSIGVLAQLEPLTDSKIVVYRRGAEAFTYGRSIIKESVLSLPDHLRRGQRVLVIDENGSCIGLAALAVDAALLNRLGAEKLVAKNLVDIGWYLRRYG